MVLHARLLGVIRHKIASGEFTERGLARQAGISQPQVHNLLKGARNLLPDTADQLMESLGIEFGELLTPEEIDRFRIK